MKLQEDIAEIEARGAIVWALAIDPPEKLQEMKEKLELSIPLLVDSDSTVIRAYGLLNEKAGSLPHPATLVIGRDGKVSWMEVNVNFRERPSNEKVLAALDALVDEATESPPSKSR